MNNEEKKVIIPLSEYEKLIEDRKTLSYAREELKKDCKERGIYAEITMTWRDLEESPTKTLNLFTKDEMLERAKKEIDRLDAVCRKLAEKNSEKDKEIERLTHRNLWQRLLNK